LFLFYLLFLFILFIICISGLVALKDVLTPPRDTQLAVVFIYFIYYLYFRCSSFIGRTNAAKGQKSTVVFILFIICISGVAAL
jgi:hypothetical protein